MLDNSTKNNTIARNTILLFFRMLIVLCITLYTSRVILNALGVEDYGIYNVVAGFVSMFAFLNASLSSTIQRFYNHSIGSGIINGVSKVYSVSLIVLLILSFFVTLASEIVGIWFVENKLVLAPERLNAARWLLQASIISLFFLFLQLPYSSIIMAKEKMDFFALIGIVDVLLRLGIAFIVSYVDFDRLLLYSWLLTLVALVDFFLYSIYAKFKFKDLKFNLVFEKESYLEILKFSGWSIVNSASQIFKNQGLNMILNVFFGPVINAARGIAFQVKSGVMGFVSNILTASRPQIVESYANGNLIRSKRIIYAISKISYFMLLSIALPLCLNIDCVLSLWLGNSVPNMTGTFTILIILTTLVDILNSPINIVIYADGNIAWFNAVTSILTILTFPISYLFLYFGYGPLSVFIVSFCFSILVQYASMVCLSKVISEFTVSNYFRKVLIPIIRVTILSSLISVSINIFMSESLFRLLISILISVVSISIIVYSLGLDNDERQMVNNMCKNIVRRFKK